MCVLFYLVCLDSWNPGFIVFIKLEKFSFKKDLHLAQSPFPPGLNHNTMLGGLILLQMSVRLLAVFCFILDPCVAHVLVSTALL